MRAPSLAAVTLLLDVIGLLVIAAGVAGALWPFLAAAALLPAGVVVLAGSALAQRTAKVKR